MTTVRVVFWTSLIVFGLIALFTARAARYPHHNKGDFLLPTFSERWGGWRVVTPIGVVVPTTEIVEDEDDENERSRSYP